MSNKIKRAIRERMAATGERYTTARAAVLEARGAVPRGELAGAEQDAGVERLPLRAVAK